MAKQVVSLGIQDPVSESGQVFFNLETSVGKKSDVVKIILIPACQIYDLDCNSNC